MFSVAIHLQNSREENQWDYVLSHFKPDQVILLGGFEPTSNVMKQAVREIPDGVSRILMAPDNGRFIKGDTPLNEFTHPENAVYIFGPNGDNISDVEADHNVYIPTDTRDEMYSWVAGAITLWHRRYG